MVNVLRSISLAAGLMAWCGAAITAEPAQPVRINIDEPALYKALLQFSQQAGLNLIFQEQHDVGDLRVPRLSGTYTPRAALERLLKDSGYTYEFIGPQAVAVHAKTNDRDRLQPNANDGAAKPDATALRLAQGSAAADATARIAAQQGSQAASAQNNSGTSSPADSEPDIEEIIVTAEKRAESIQTLPVAISAYSGDTLAERKILDANSLSQLNPSVRVPLADSNDTRIVIRGIGSFGGFEPAVSFVQDGVAYSSTRIPTLNFFDVERMEVLRGPQGTIGGRNATAGGIYVTSKRPTEEAEGYLKGTLGNYSRLAVEGAFSGPLIADKLLARLALQVDQGDGWITNSVLRQDVRDIDTKQARLSLEQRFSDDFRALLILQAVVNRSKRVGFAWGRARPDQPIPAPFDQPGIQFNPDGNTFQTNYPSHYNDKYYQGTLRLEKELGSNATLTAISGYFVADNEYGADLDGNAIQFNYINPRLQSLHQASQELTLTGDITDRLDYIVGGLYQYQSLLPSFTLISLPAFTPSNPLRSREKHTLSSWSGYGQLRYRLTDQVRLTAGARYTYDDKDIHSQYFGIAEAKGELTSDAWTPRFSVDWQPSEQLMLYAAMARGFKSSGFDQFAFPSRFYNPEFVWNYEVGVKAQGLDRRLQADVTVFNMDYTDLQQRLIYFDPQLGLQTRTVNAASAEIRGVEFNIQARPTPAVRLTAAATYLDTEYSSLNSADPLYPELGVPAPNGTNIRDLSGNRLAGAPEWQFNVFGDYTRPVSSALEAVFSASYSWNGQSYTDFYNNPGIEEDSRGLIDVAFGLQTSDGTWKASAFVQNLTDELYVTTASGNANTNLRGVWFGEPRRYGVTIERRF